MLGFTGLRCMEYIFANQKSDISVYKSIGYGAMWLNILPMPNE